MDKIIQNYVGVLQQATNFNGRADRSEYWLFFLANIVVAFGLGIVDSMIGLPVLGFLFTLAMIVPSVAVAIRRLHDTGRSGWWLLIGFIPFLGLVAMIVLMVLPSNPGANQYGSPSRSTGNRLATA